MPKERGLPRDWARLESYRVGQYTSSELPLANSNTFRSTSVTISEDWQRDVPCLLILTQKLKLDPKHRSHLTYCAFSGFQPLNPKGLASEP